ncbi:hypothetical protein O3799_11680 [Fusobacterium periodonticum]|uniref:hypothetical protein n=1 Tax=Fusobacterium periodonticum TaxID=860 RepID=UPI00352F80E1
MKVTTKEKIKKIRLEIEKGTSPADIKKKFFGTETKKNEYLSRWGSYFDDEEIAYLNNTDEETNKLTKDNIVRNIEEIEVAEVKTELEVAKTDTPNSLTELESNFFKDENNLKSLIEMVKKYRSQNENLIEVIEAGMVNIPIEAKELELNAILSVRTNKEIYAKIIEMAQKNKIGKGQFLTYILWDFLKRNS